MQVSVQGQGQCRAETGKYQRHVYNLLLKSKVDDRSQRAVTWNVSDLKPCLSVSVIIKIYIFYLYTNIYI